MSDGPKFVVKTVIRGPKGGRITIGTVRNPDPKLAKP